MFPVAASAATVSGNVYLNNRTSSAGASKTVFLVVNGAKVDEAQTDGAGFYTTTAALSAGDRLLVFLDNESQEGTSVTVSDGTDILDLDIYDDHVVTRHDNGGALSIADMDAALDFYSDTDILYSVVAGAVTVIGGGTRLYVPGGHTFTPGNDVSTAYVEIEGTFVAGSEVITLTRDWDSSAGVFTAGTSTIRFTGTDATYDPGSSSCYNLFVELDASDDLTISGTVTVDNTLFLNGADNGSDVRTGTIDVAGDVIVGVTNGGGTALVRLTGAGSQTVSSAGGWLPHVEVDKT
ncbi:MAG: hypothetical protein HKN17_03235, partial [Rhodothermales bacterium]|nr:hypothetical protein [Rhodothermales bacterium]